jgi:hypothetical protein
MVVLVESEVAWSSEESGNGSELRLAMAAALTTMTAPRRTQRLGLQCARSGHGEDVAELLVRAEAVQERAQQRRSSSARRQPWRARSRAAAESRRAKEYGREVRKGRGGDAELGLGLSQ